MINLKSGKQVTFDYYVRFISLLEALDEINKKSEELNISLDNDKWIKPIAIQKYMDERYESIKHDLTVELTLGL